MLFIVYQYSKVVWRVLIWNEKVLWLGELESMSQVESSFFNR